MSLFLHGGKILSLGIVGEDADGDRVEDCRGVGKPNGVESSTCPSQSIDRSVIGRELEDPAYQLWWEVGDAHGLGQLLLEPGDLILGCRLGSHSRAISSKDGCEV